MWTTIWTFLQDHWSALLVGGVVTGLGAKALAFADKQGVAFLISEFEKLRAYTNSTAIGSQIQADDAVIDILESTLPEALHELDDAAQKALALGNIHAVDWTVLGKDLWAKAKTQIQGGVHDYLEHSSFQDGEALSALIAKRFFITQRLAAKGLITDPPRSADVAPQDRVVFQEK